MSEIRRLLDDDATPGERALLRAASSDRPADPKARERTLAALGLAASVGGVATLAQVKGTAKAVGLVQKLASLSLFKWSVVVVSVATVATGVVVTQNALVSPTQTTAASPVVPNLVPNGAPNIASDALPFSPATPATPARPEGTSQREARERGSDPSGPAADPRPAGGTPSPVPAPAHSLATNREVSTPTASPEIHDPTAPPSQPTLPPTAAPTASSIDPLAEQVVVLDRGRAALAAGDAAGCLRAVEDFRRRFPRGALSTEATVLEVRARLASGDRAGASSVAHRFAEENPKSPYRTRILEIVAAP